MINKFKKIIMLFIILIIPYSFVFADTIDYTKRGSIYVNNNYENAGISSINIVIYKIASLNNSGVYEFVNVFAEKEKNIKIMSSSELGNYAKELRDFILKNNINYLANKSTNNNEEILFDSLELGIYLIVFDNINSSSGDVVINPLIVEVPSIDQTNNSYVYNVNVVAKVEKITDTSGTSSTSDESSASDTTILGENTGDSDSNSNSDANSSGSSNGKKGIFSLPVTSDDIIKYFIGLLLSIVGIVAIVLYIRGRKKEKNEEKNF